MAEDRPEDRHAKAAERARRDIERLQAEGEIVGTSAMVRAAKKAQEHFSATDAPQDDPAEIWGGRIARVLALGFTAFLIWWLVNFLAR
jgi:hypothetical protein